VKRHTCIQLARFAGAKLRSRDISNARYNAQQKKNNKKTTKIQVYKDILRGISLGEKVWIPAKSTLKCCSRRFAFAHQNYAYIGFLNKNNKNQ